MNKRIKEAEEGPIHNNPRCGMRWREALAEPQEPVAWATVCDGVIDSCSLTKTAAKLKAENLRDRNRGRNFVFGVRPLSYSTQRKPLTDDQKQAIHNETGAGHALICLVESYINGIEESNT